MRTFFITLSILFNLLITNYKTPSQPQSEFSDMDENTIAIFEERLNTVIKAKFFVFKNEKFYSEDFLKTKDQALANIKTLLQIKYPKYDDNKNILYFIGEDKSKKIWFVYVRSYQSSIGNGISFIILKNNCKIISFEKTK